MVWKTIPKKNLDRDWTSYPTYEDWKKQNQSFEGLASYLRPDGARALLTRPDEQVQVQTAKVSDNFFSVLNVPALVGRTISPAEAGSGANVVVLSYGMWKRRFASAPEVVGQTLEIDEAAYEVIGVMPATFEFPDKDVEVWLPIVSDPRWHAFQTVRIADAFGVVGRLKAGLKAVMLRPWLLLDLPTIRTGPDRSRTARITIAATVR
jgi:putative ABC transport system permease protein